MLNCTNVLYEACFSNKADECFGKAKDLFIRSYTGNVLELELKIKCVISK